MKSIQLIFAFIILSSTSLQAQIIPSSCEAADSIVEDYFIDATQLALRKIFEQNLPEKDSVEVPTVHVDTILDAMIAVYNIDTPERDSVVDIFNIHSRHSISMGDIRAVINTGFSITDPLLDSIMTKYGISANLQTIGNNNYALFRVDEKYNIFPLIELVESVNGVSYAYANEYYLGDNNIESTINSGHVELIYSFAWGDCMSGCMYRRYWEFKVYLDCSVEFIESYGNTDPPIPPALSLKEQDSFETLNLYPNPANSELNFSLKNNSSLIHLEIFDVSGQKIKTLKHESGGNGEFNQSIDISNLKQGLYFCEFSNGEVSITQKFIKE